MDKTQNKRLTHAGTEHADFSHCLREEFTRHLLGRLADQGISLNVTGKRGTGKTRLLKDIRRCNIQGKEMHLLDMENEAHQEFDLLIQELEKSKSRHILLLNNCPSDSFDRLTLLAEKKNLTLLCITAERQPYIDNLEIHEMPALTRRQVAAELDRRMDEPTLWWFQANPDDKSLIMDRIHEKPLPYPRLCFLAETIVKNSKEVQSVKFKKRLNRWNGEFNRRHSMVQVSLPGFVSTILKKLLGT